MTHDEILTIPEVAEMLQIADKTVLHAGAARGIPVFKVGGQWRFSALAIRSWIEQRTRFATKRETSSALGYRRDSSARGATRTTQRKHP